MTIFQSLKKLAIVERLFWQCVILDMHNLVAVAVVERFKQESVYRLSTGTKGVAIVERWPLWKAGC